MRRVEGSCPGCGAPVPFKTGSALVTVCQFCHSVVARGDRRLEDLGKVAAVIETGSPLQLGLKGRYHGKAFELVGRAQFSHEAGGTWDEWYAAFRNGRWGWLAEAQGRFYLTFEHKLKPGAKFPPLEQLGVGERIEIPGVGEYTVVEIGTGQGIGAAGEIPWRLVPGEPHQFVDLYGDEGKFATLDYGSTPPAIYVGEEVTLAEIGITPDVLPPEHVPKKIATKQLSCPRCGGSLELRAPDQSERVTCPSCDSLLDIDQGNLKYLTSLTKSRIDPIIPLGAKGTLKGVEYTVIGFLRRSVTFEGVDYYWMEYLLYEPHTGFRWLVHSDGHWSFVEPISPGEVSFGTNDARYDGTRFRIFQKGKAHVRYVLGEFYWKVSVNEVVRTEDYIAPPRMISVEKSISSRSGSKGEKGEINVSLGTYLPHDELEQAFGLAHLWRPDKPAPNQPYPHNWIFPLWGAFTAALLFVGCIFFLASDARTLFERQYSFSSPAAEKPQVVFANETFELRRGRNIEVTARTQVNNSWIYFEGDLFNEETGLVQAFDLSVEYYHGVSGGESWREGSQTGRRYLSALPPGRYSLRLEGYTPPGRSEMVTIIVREGVFRWLHLILALLAVSIPALGILFHRMSFERSRWEDSDYSPYHGSDD